MWRWTTSSYPRAGLGLYSPGHFLVGNVTGSHRRGLGQGRTMNHHLINEIGRQAVHYQLPGQKARAREGAAAMWPRTLGFNRLDSGVVFHSSCEHPPTSWLRPETWPRWRRSCSLGSEKRRGWVTAMSPKAAHTSSTVNKKQHPNTLRNVSWSLERFPKREKTQSKFPLWKMKKCLPKEKNYHQDMNLIDLF